MISALQKKPEEINRRSADMWSFAVLLWELVTREVPFADLSNMEIGMKVSHLCIPPLQTVQIQNMNRITLIHLLSLMSCTTASGSNRSIRGDVKVSKTLNPKLDRLDSDSH